MGAPSPAAAFPTPITAVNMVTTASVVVMALLAIAAPALGDTSNYVKQAISTNFSEHEGLPTQGVLNGTVTELDDISHRIVLNKTDAALNCSSGNFVSHIIPHSVSQNPAQPLSFFYML